MTWTQEEIKAVLQNAEGTTGGKPNRYLIYRMLQGLYQKQTTHEQAAEYTSDKNNVGFNAYDATLLTNVAKTSLAYQNLTICQAAMVGRRLVKYAGQLERIAAEKQAARLAAA